MSIIRILLEYAFTEAPFLVPAGCVPSPFRQRVIARGPFKIRFVLCGFFFFYVKPVRGGPLSRSCRHFAFGSLHRLGNIILYRVIVSDMIPSERIYYNIVILYTVTTVLCFRSRRSNGYHAMRDHRPAEYSSDEVMHENNIIILLYLSLSTPRISSGLIKWDSIQHLYGNIYDVYDVLGF